MPKSRFSFAELTRKPDRPIVLPRSRLEFSIWLWLLRLLPAILSSFVVVVVVLVFPVHSASFSTRLLRA